MPNREELDKLSLGENSTEYPTHYMPELLQCFSNPTPGRKQWIKLNCPEFTSLCPKTDQPDFGLIVINYVADELMVESKSLKLYLFSFRQHGGFHEECVQIICNDLVKLLNPKYLEVIGDFNPRGGISIVPYSTFSCDEQSYKDLEATRFSQFSLRDSVIYPSRFTF